jgi:hypothetical protein
MRTIAGLERYHTGPWFHDVVKFATSSSPCDVNAVSVRTSQSLSLPHIEVYSYLSTEHSNSVVDPKLFFFGSGFNLNFGFGSESGFLY